MTGNPPVVTLALDSGSPYPAGSIVTATATVGDADSGSQSVPYVDSMGRHDTVTITTVDTAAITWTWQSTGAPVGVNVNPLHVPAPQGSDVLVCTVTDGQGNTTETTIPVTVPSAMLLGTSTSVNGAGPAWDTATGGCVRVYCPPGHIYGWSSAAMVAAVKRQPKTIIWSMKDAPTQDNLGPIVASVPAGITLVVIVHHEPEQGPAAGDPTIAVYQADVKAAATIINALPAAQRARVLLAECFTQYAQLHGKTPWQSYWTGLADVIAADSYTDAVSTTAYPTGAQQWALLVSMMAATGKPGMAPEYGAKRLATDTDGTGCAAMIADHVAYARSRGVTAAVWWDTAPFALEARAPELAAWQRACNGQ